jgi:hypothetical protein
VLSHAPVSDAASATAPATPAAPPESAPKRILVAVLIASEPISVPPAAAAPAAAPAARRWCQAKTVLSATNCQQGRQSRAAGEHFRCVTLGRFVIQKVIGSTANDCRVHANRSPTRVVHSLGAIACRTEFKTNK